MTAEMTLADWWPDLLLHLLPLAAFYAVPAVYAIFRWRRHPRLSGLVLAALSLSLLSNALWLLAGPGSQPKGRPIPQLALSAYSVAGVVFWGLMIFAAFFGFHEGRRSAISEADHRAADGAVSEPGKE